MSQSLSPQASDVFALLWVCADACGHIVIHRGWEWDRVLILLSLVENDLIPLETGVEATNPREFAGAGVPEISWGWEEKKHNTWKLRCSSRMLDLDAALEPKEGRPGTRVTALGGVIWRLSSGGSPVHETMHSGLLSILLGRACCPKQLW